MANIQPLNMQIVAPPEIATARRAAIALQLFSLFPLGLSALCAVHITPWTHTNMLFVLMMIGALTGALASAFMLCIKVPSAAPGGNLQVMTTVSLIAAIFYGISSVAIVFTVGGELGSLLDRTACSSTLAVLTQPAAATVDCETHPVGQFVLIDIMLGLVGAFCHLGLARLGHQAQFALWEMVLGRPSEKGLLVSPA